MASEIKDKIPVNKMWQHLAEPDRDPQNTQRTPHTVTEHPLSAREPLHVTAECETTDTHHQDLTPPQQTKPPTSLVQRFLQAEKKIIGGTSSTLKKIARFALAAVHQNNTHQEHNEATEIDTDDPEIRKRRIVNQHELESNLQDLNSLSFQQRLTAIRQGLFKEIPHVRGEAIDELRTTNIGSERDVYVEAKRLRGYTETVGKVVDASAKEICNLPDEEKADAARRLSSAFYTLCIPIHPYRDGNGQTLRTAAMSYLHELAPETYEDKYFLYKLSKKHVNDQITTKIQVSKLDTLSYLPDDQARKLGELRGAVQFSDNVKNRINSNAPDEINSMMLQESENTINRLFPDDEERQKWIEYVYQEIEKAKSLQETAGGTLGESRTHGFYEYVLNSPEGLDLIRSYILHGPPETETLNSGYKKAAIQYFERVSQEIDRVLETKEEHESNYHRLFPSSSP